MNKPQKRIGILFSGGKDSCMAAYLAKKEGYEISCLITLFSENKESYMFHTPSIEKTKYQAQSMNLPLLVYKTKGEKEEELIDLENAIKDAKKKYKLDAIATGALYSVYQASRIQKICDKLKLKCFNPLWHKEEIPYLKELLENKFKIIIIGVFAYPLDKTWLGREINDQFIEEVAKLKEKYQIHGAGEGGEFETFVLNCPLFKEELKISSFKDLKEGENSFRRELEIKPLSLNKKIK